MLIVSFLLLLQCDHLEEMKSKEIGVKVWKQKQLIKSLEQGSVDEQARIIDVKQEQQTVQHELANVGASTKTSGDMVTPLEAKQKALREQEEADWSEAHQTSAKVMAAKKEIYKLKIDYAKDKRKHGCDWKGCPDDTCLHCPRGYAWERPALLRPETLKCECDKCMCRSTPLLPLEGLRWIDTDTVTAGKVGCKMEEKSQLALCREGPKVCIVVSVALVELISPLLQAVGCAAGLRVDFYCGCAALYEWAFVRTQKVMRQCG